jgi:predicted PP-loop superfamily ATPase
MEALTQPESTFSSEKAETHATAVAMSGGVDS